MSDKHRATYHGPAAVSTEPTDLGEPGRSSGRPAPLTREAGNGPSATHSRHAPRIPAGGSLWWVAVTALDRHLLTVLRALGLAWDITAAVLAVRWYSATRPLDRYRKASARP